MERILVVDDEPDIAMSLKQGLEHAGYSVDTFEDPLKALAEFKPYSYGLIVSDIKMPNMNGFEMVYEMQRLDAGIQVIFLTGFVDMYEELRKLFGKLQVREVVRKPIGVSELLGRIRSLQISRELPAATKTAEKQKPEARALEASGKELARWVLSAAKTRLTLGQMGQQLRSKLNFTWEEFIGVVNSLVAKGYLTSGGNGFDLLYWTTDAGEKTLEGMISVRTPPAT